MVIPDRADAEELSVAIGWHYPYASTCRLSERPWFECTSAFGGRDKRWGLVPQSQRVTSEAVCG